MKTLLIDSAKLPKNPTTAHARMAIEIAEQLGLPLVSTKEEVQNLDASDFDQVAVVGSAFYPETAAIEAWIRQNSSMRIIWLNNEWQCSPNSEYARLIKDHESLVISSSSKNKVRGNNEFIFMNLNVLLFSEPNKIIDKKYDLIYYGSWRTDRRLYVQKYFSKKRESWYLSSSTKNLRKFKQLAGADAIFCKRLSWDLGRETLNNFRYSLYIEDEFSHKHYTHLANRFYEALFCNAVQFFDKSCLNSIKESGYCVPHEFIVSAPEQIEELISNESFYLYAYDLQREWVSQAREEKEVAINKLREVLC